MEARFSAKERKKIRMDDDISNNFTGGKQFLRALFNGVDGSVGETENVHPIFDDRREGIQKRLQKEWEKGSHCRSPEYDSKIPKKEGIISCEVGNMGEKKKAVDYSFVSNFNLSFSLSPESCAADGCPEKRMLAPTLDESVVERKKKREHQ